MFCFVFCLCFRAGSISLWTGHLRCVGGNESIAFVKLNNSLDPLAVTFLNFLQMHIIYSIYRNSYKFHTNKRILHTDMHTTHICIHIYIQYAHSTPNVIMVHTETGRATPVNDFHFHFVIIFGSVTELNITCGSYDGYYGYVRYDS